MFLLRQARLTPNLMTVNFLGIRKYTKSRIENKCLTRQDVKEYQDTDM